jgi:hypothetical protein
MTIHDSLYRKWNYRVCRDVVDGEEFLAIYEVYYNEDGKIISHTESPTTICASTLEEMNHFISNMVGQPILDLVNMRQSFEERRKDELV